MQTKKSNWVKPELKKFNKLDLVKSVGGSPNTVEDAGACYKVTAS